MKKTLFDGRAQIDAVTMDSIDWWSTYGSETPKLAEIAKKVLSQPISSSLAERNWSTYSYIHNVKRNRLNCKKADKLVFIHSNKITIQDQTKNGTLIQKIRTWRKAQVQDLSGIIWMRILLTLGKTKGQE